MVESTSKSLVPLFVSTTAIGLFLLVGCNRGDEKKTVEVVSDPPSVYMKDPAFRKALDEAQSELKGLLKIESRLSDELTKMYGEVKLKLASDDKLAIENELKKNPEWESVRQKLQDVKKAIAERREKTVDVVRRRIAPRKVSK